MAFSASELSALHAQGLLAGFLDREEFRRAVQRGDWHRVHRAGEVILDKGCAPAGIFLVVHGTLELMLRNRDGDEHIAGLSRAGDCCGLEAVLGGRPSVYELRALTQTTLLFLPRELVLEWIDTIPAFAQRVMQTVAREVGQLYAEIDGIQSRSTLERLACYLHCGERRQCRGGQAREQFSISLPYFKLAQRLGASQPHLSRALRSLEDNGVITRDGRHLQVRDAQAFARLLCNGCRHGRTRPHSPTAAAG